LGKIAAKQKKHRKSLSPEQKAQIKSTNAVAHKKQYELLPLMKKARHVETWAEQCHEHLTEEEKIISAQSTNAVAHKKQYELLPLEKKKLDVWKPGLNNVMNI
jgi:hypothetical protein